MDEFIVVLKDHRYFSGLLVANSFLPKDVKLVEIMAKMAGHFYFYFTFKNK